MSELPDSSEKAFSNTRKSRTNQENQSSRVQKPIIVGTVVERKKSITRKIFESFGGDGPRDVGEYLVLDVVIPSIKQFLSDFITNGADRLLFGSSGGGSRRSAANGRRGDKRYNSMFRGGDTTLSSRARATHSFDEIVLDSRGDAERIVDALITLIEDYDIASVADLYSLLDLTANHVDHKWGWTDLRSADVRRVSEGYLLVLPKPELIE